MGPSTEMMVKEGTWRLTCCFVYTEERLGQITCGPRSQHSGCPWGEGVCISPAALTPPPHLSGIIKYWYLTTAIICVSGSQLSSEVCDRSVGIPVVMDGHSSVWTGRQPVRAGADRTVCSLRPASRGRCEESGNHAGEGRTRHLTQRGCPGEN